jgi:N-acetylglucosamine kinase-like BadF-type ATPase
MSRSLFLGVDGGGTKTRFVLVDSDGNLVAAHEGPGSYHVEIGLERLRAVLADGLAAVLARAGSDRGTIGYAFFGIPAYGEDSDAQPLLDAMPEPLLGHRRFRCGNDMVCAWAGSLGAQDGINIVAGTGSIAYGERRGRSARAGGWGEIFSDEGSAYWIAVQALNIFSRMSDGRLPKGPLHDAFRAALDLRADLDICAKVMNARTRERIAAFSQLVARAAQEGDASAIEIFDRAAGDLASIVEAVRRALEFERGEPVPVSYSGGVFQAGPLILGPLQRLLRQQSAAYVLKAPRLRPGIGAAIYAAKLAGEPLSARAMERLEGI